MKTLNQYINEKLVLNNDTKLVNPYEDFEIDIDSSSDAKAFLKAIEEVYGKTGIKVKDGRYSNVIFTGETKEDFLKVCGLIAVAWNMDGTDSVMQYNGDEEDENDLAFYIPGYGDEIEANFDEIEKYGKLWIKWLEDNDFDYR